MDYKKAKDIAVNICYELQPYCGIINIAGSIRRKKPEVKDIEIVCLPKHETIKDMFGGLIGSKINDKFSGIIKGLGIIEKGKVDGKMMQIGLKEDIMLDLFMPDEKDYFRQYAIRTGSADYSAKVIASAWVKNGWVGTSEGLRRRADCEGKLQSSGKILSKCIKSNPELPPVWISEKHFFEWIKVHWILPEKRI